MEILYLWCYASCSPSDLPLLQRYAVLYLLSSAHCLIWPVLSLPWGLCIHHQQRSVWQFVLMAHVPETPSNCKRYPAKSNLCLCYHSLWHYQNWTCNKMVCIYKINAHSLRYNPLLFSLLSTKYVKLNLIEMVVSVESQVYRLCK